MSDEPWDSYSNALLPKALAYPWGETSSNDSWTGDVARTVGGVEPLGGADTCRGWSSSPTTGKSAARNHVR
jgi:hypothetical protein